MWADAYFICRHKYLLIFFEDANRLRIIVTPSILGS